MAGSKAMQAVVTDASARSIDADLALAVSRTEVPLDAERSEAFMAYLSRSEECGAWHRVAVLLEGKTFARIKKIADEELLQRIAVWEEKLAKAREYEAIHGQGSL